MSTLRGMGNSRDAIAENTRRERAALRWSQVGLAERAGLPRRVVMDIELSRRRVSLDDCVALCTALDIPLRTLLQGDDEAIWALGLGWRSTIER